MENENGDVDTSKQQPEEIQPSEENAEKTPKTYSEAELEEFKKKAELAENYKIRAEKAESKLKKAEVNVEKKSEEKNLSTKDMLALIEAKVSTEDFDEVVNYAAYKKVTVSEALKDKVLRVVLKEKGEERQTAEATNSRNASRNVSTTPSPESLITKARQGQLPESDEDINALVEAEMARKKMRK